jgi:hypothetical protein
MKEVLENIELYLIDCGKIMGDQSFVADDI